MKIGLYLQQKHDQPNETEEKAFREMMLEVAASDIDLLVFPEFCYTPFSDEAESFLYGENATWIEDQCLSLSELVDCAIVFSGSTKNCVTYSLFANAKATENERLTQWQIKHTATHNSAFDFEPYSQEFIEDLFSPVHYQNKNIGMTICYDCNHAAFSRAYGLSGVDIIVNSTDGGVTNEKWLRYNKVRAIENKCYVLVTMGCKGKEKGRSISRVYGFSPTGAEMPFVALNKGVSSPDEPDTVYIYDTDDNLDSLNVDAGNKNEGTKNEHESFYYPVSGTKDLLKEAEKVEKNIYVMTHGEENIVICLFKNDEILHPEDVLASLYHSSLQKYTNKRYILVSSYEVLDNDLFEKQLSDVLRVRAMENYCAVILQSPQIYRCYQTGKTRSSQIVRLIDGHWGIDLERTKGPEMIWKNKTSPWARASWRRGYEKLISVIHDWAYSK